MRKLALAGSCLLLAAVLAGTAQAPAQAQGGKLVVIAEENESYGSIVGNTAQAPYLNQLISQGKLFTDYTGVTGGSEPNYTAMTAGVTIKHRSAVPNVFSAIDGTSGALTWKEFMEGMGGNCGAGGSWYTTTHDPGYVEEAPSCSLNDVPVNTSTFNPASLPDFSYIVPDQCDDMHSFSSSCPAFYGTNTGSSAIAMGDSWLAHVVPQLLAQPGVTVLITWDEVNSGTTPPMHVAAIEAGAGVTPGSADGAAYNHYSLEAGLYGYLGLGPAPGGGATATPLPF